MPPDDPRLTANERADLVAYLDGELDGDRAAAISARLNQSPQARREAEALEEAWELLEALPRPEPSPELTSRTLTIALEDGDAQIAGLTAVSRRPGRRAWTLALATLALATLGFAAARRLRSDPTDRLARDLSVAEDLDGYRALGSLEELRRLQAALDGEGP